MTPILCRRLSALLSVTALLIVAIGIRLELLKNHVWFPNVPLTIGDWTATEVPLDRTTLSLLGSPPADGYRFINTFGEHVECHVIATTTYAAYHEPLICMSGYGYSKTAYKTMSVLGPKLPIRALILKSQTDGARVLMYYWVQFKDGTTSGQNDLALHQNLFPRFSVGIDKALHAEPSCIVRAYILIHPADHLGLQARRSLDQVCVGLYNALKREGQDGARGGRPQ